MNFKPSYLAPILNSFSPNQTVWIAYSGGLDSHVLLHALISHYPHLRLGAIHIHHGLSPFADDWAAHCEQVCQELRVKYEQINVDAHPKSGESPEEAARNARYDAFMNKIAPGDYLLTGHHQDDQAETVLLQLFRGTGIKGLAGMSIYSPLAQGLLVRPLLAFKREELLMYARENHLKWIEDESNENPRFDRNFIRHSVLPLIQKRWPGITSLLSQTATHCAEANEVLDALAKEDLNVLSSRLPPLSIKNLLSLSQARRKNVLRYWFQTQGLAIPNAKHLEQLEQTVLLAKPDANPKLCWGNVEIRRYRDDLYIFKNPPDSLTRVSPLFQSGEKTIIWKKESGQGLSPALDPASLQIRYRVGGERFHPLGRQGSHPLKKLLQEWGIPPWERDKIPLLYHGDILVCVIGYCVSSTFAAKPDEEGWQPSLIKE